jgi:hypothetical protein
MPGIQIPNSARNFVLAPLLAVAYSIYEILAGGWLFQICWRPGPSSTNGWAFETPLMAPLAYIITKSTVGLYQVVTAGKVAIILVLLMPIFVGWVTAHCIQRKLNGDHNVFGPYKWRLLFLLASWVFVPVPMKATLSAVFAD